MSAAVVSTSPPEWMCQDCAANLGVIRRRHVGLVCIDCAFPEEIYRLRVPPKVKNRTRRDDVRDAILEALVGVEGVTLFALRQEVGAHAGGEKSLFYQTAQRMVEEGELVRVPQPGGSDLVRLGGPR